MKRFFPLSLLSLAATATFVISPVATASMSAQDSPIIAELNLTSAQQQAVKAIFQDVRSDLQAILTDNQQEQFWQVYEEANNMKTAAMAVDGLTFRQKKAMRVILQDFKGDLSQVLTNEQLAKLRSLQQ
jgi:Spy/CpxP family protein refolding chaperone